MSFLINLLIALLIISLLYKIIMPIVIAFYKTNYYRSKESRCEFLSSNDLDCEHYWGKIKFSNNQGTCPNKCKYKSSGDNNEYVVKQLYAIKPFRIIDKAFRVLPEITAAILIIINIKK